MSGQSTADRTKYRRTPQGDGRHISGDIQLFTDYMRNRASTDITWSRLGWKIASKSMSYASDVRLSTIASASTHHRWYVPSNHSPFPCLIGIARARLASERKVSSQSSQRRPEFHQSLHANARRTKETGRQTDIQTGSAFCWNTVSLTYNFLDLSFFFHSFQNFRKARPFGFYARPEVNKDGSTNLFKWWEHKQILQRTGLILQFNFGSFRSRDISWLIHVVVLVLVVLIFCRKCGIPGKEGVSPTLRQHSTWIGINMRIGE